MSRNMFTIVSVVIFLALPASGFVVRGTISDSATGAPISNVKIVLMLIAGEIEIMLDSSRTGTTGSYSLACSSQSRFESYIYTIADGYYFQHTSVYPAGIDDTITKDIKLKSIPAGVSASPHFKESHSITVRMAKSWLYLSGIKTVAIVDLYNFNGRRLFRTAIPVEATEVRLPEWLAAGRYHVSIRTNGRLIRGTAVFR